MPVQPLTPAGVTAKTTELYALSNSLLNAQADAAESDFDTWIKDNFSLSTAQSTYLSGMNSHALKYFGSQCSVAFRSRRTVSLVSPDPLPPTEKWIMSESTLIVSANNAGVLETTGALTFKMDYR
ncbi:hypothetical protein FMM05_07120 [Flavobacterium zepuense]|uniref:Uncharacterized protein n=1 Tax=Flavobacterium zepuense TaxID=2593302 RepID=A0A552V678_9FLAO|nr:hypothetical protein [Flavobacterium zepuense]TRW25986.1 hypothetical protein FMM05_07120 [Flavobacterium zepuense]